MKLEERKCTIFHKLYSIFLHPSKCSFCKSVPLKTHLKTYPRGSPGRRRNHCARPWRVHGRRPNTFSAPCKPPPQASPTSLERGPASSPPPRCRGPLLGLRAEGPFPPLTARPPVHPGPAAAGVPSSWALPPRPASSLS